LGDVFPSGILVSKLIAIHRHVAKDAAGIRQLYLSCGKGTKIASFNP
jgi:hypothetical protein